MLTRRHTLAATAAMLALPAMRAGAHSAPSTPFVVPEHLRPTLVPVRAGFGLGEIIVISAQHYLYHVVEEGRAMRYGVAVGREGLLFRGATVVARKAEWPSWRPTPQMIARNPGRYARHANGMRGGPNNPLGARALYLYRNGKDTSIRIHGTTEPESIGKSVSNGCIRMVNEHIIALYDGVPVGTKVTIY